MMPDNISKLGIVIGYRCNFSCEHCANKGFGADLTATETANICSAINDYKIKSIQFSGGEPTLYLNKIRAILSGVSARVRPRVRITTNGHFAETADKAVEVLSAIPGLKYVQLSYDRFHKKFLPGKNIHALAEACRRLKLDLSFHLLLQSPLDVVLMKDLKEAGNFPILLRKSLSMGLAKKNDLAYKNIGFDPKVLSKRCPGLEIPGYICGQGFTICCSLLMFNGPVPGIAHASLKEHLASPFYKFMAKNTFSSIMRALNIKKEALLPEHSSSCHLCEFLVKMGARRLWEGRNA